MKKSKMRSRLKKIARKLDDFSFKDFIIKYGVHCLCVLLIAVTFVTLAISRQYKDELALYKQSVGQVNADNEKLIEALDEEITKNNRLNKKLQENNLVIEDLKNSLNQIKEDLNRVK